MATQKAAGSVMAVSKKYTVQSTGIWETIRRVFAVDPNRSNGVPLNAVYRNPTPGANDPAEYTDPVTLPAGDIADNPYWKRDVRRQYPRLSVMTQGDVVGLLSVGSAAKPTQELIGDAGAKALVEVKQEGEEKGLAAFFAKDSKALAAVIAAAGNDGLPPMPPSMNHGVTRDKAGSKAYELLNEQAYPEKYPCRTFE